MLVPESPGILCAQGLIVSDLKEDFVSSRRASLDAHGLKQLRAVIRDLAGDAGAWFKREAVAQPSRSIEIVLDMRYVGQNFELPVSLGRSNSGKVPGLPAGQALHERFFASHAQHYGFFNPDDPVEVINVRLTARGSLSYPAPAAKPKARAAAEPVGRRPVYFSADKPARTPVFDRAALIEGQSIKGPAIIQQLDTTTVLAPGDRLRVDAAKNLMIEIAP